MSNFLNHHVTLLLPVSILLTFTAFTPGSDGLKSIRLEAPRYIREGEHGILSCQYDIETRSLYAVKFYHGTEEFYRYLPKESPPQQVFPKKGINVNVTSSNDHQVVIANASRDTSGKFKCVVSAEITFKTLEDVQEIGIVAIGYDSPKLYVDQVDYSQGDTARANCSVDRTYPPVNITWFINDAEVPKVRSKTYLLPDMRNPDLTSTISTLTFQLPDQGVMGINGLRLKCTGQLYDVYSMSSEMKISLKPRRLSMMSTSPDTLLRSSSNTNSTTTATSSSSSRVDIPSITSLEMVDFWWVVLNLFYLQQFWSIVVVVVY